MNFASPGNPDLNSNSFSPATPDSESQSHNNLIINHNADTGANSSLNQQQIYSPLQPNIQLDLRPQRISKTNAAASQTADNEYFANPEDKKLSEMGSKIRSAFNYTSASSYSQSSSVPVNNSISSQSQIQNHKPTNIESPNKQPLVRKVVFPVIDR